MGYVLIAAGLGTGLYGRKRSMLEPHERRIAYVVGAFVALVGVALVTTS